MAEENPKISIRGRVDKILEEATGRDLSSWERNEFLPTLKYRIFVTDKQEKILAEIEARLKVDPDEEDEVNES